MRFGQTGNHVVIEFTSPELTRRNALYLEAGAKSDFDSYHPHITLCKDADVNIKIGDLPDFNDVIVLGPEITSFVLDDNDAQIPGSVYASRQVLNKETFKRFCELEGFRSADDLHVTIIHSKTPLNKDVIPDRIGYILNMSSINE